MVSNLPARTRRRGWRWRRGWWARCCPEGSPPPRHCLLRAPEKKTLREQHSRATQSTHMHTRQDAGMYAVSGSDPASRPATLNTQDACMTEIDRRFRCAHSRAADVYAPVVVVAQSAWRRVRAHRLSGAMGCPDHQHTHTHTHTHTQREREREREAAAAAAYSRYVTHRI